jgi:hypothetical protein
MASWWPTTQHRPSEMPGTCLWRAAGTGRIEPEYGSDSAPETCHSQVLRDKNFERAVKDGLWPAAVGHEQLIRRCET